MTRFNFLFLFIVGMVLTFDTGKAQTFLKTVGNWSAFQVASDKVRLCYIASAPTKEKGNYKRRDDTYVLVTHRPTEKKKDIFELRAGYTYKKNSNVLINIDGQKFELFTSGGTAWAKTSKIDRALAIAMKRGRFMTATGTSSRGTKTVDTYSLKGFTAAYNTIGTKCSKK